MSKNINHISSVETGYELLKFRFDFSKYTKHFKFNNRPKVPSNIDPVSYEYRHAEFGGYVDDPEHALGHFKYVLGELKKANDERKKSYLLAELERDYQNYSYCYTEKEPAVVLEQLTETLFYYGRWKKVVEVVSREHKVNDGPDAVDAYSFDDLFIRMGDYLLFEKNEPRNALNLYQMASWDWIPKDNEGNPFFGYDQYHRAKPKTMLSADEKKLWHDKFMSYGSLLLGAYGSGEDRSFKFSSIYRKLNELVPGYENDAIILGKLDDFTRSVRDTLNHTGSEKDYFNTARAAVLMMRTICQKFLTTELFRLCFEMMVSRIHFRMESRDVHRL